MAEKLYYRIGEVAQKFNVQPTLIRYWEREFNFIKPHKSDKGTRMFTRKDVERFEIIYHLVKEKGMTIQGTRDYFKKHYDSKSLEQLEIINTLKKTRNLLSDVKSVLEEYRSEDQ
jgi:DNA-binding transcriptional MerR regulator